jgi:hypothetical protein
MPMFVIVSGCATPPFAVATDVERATLEKIVQRRPSDGMLSRRAAQYNRDEACRDDFQLVGAREILWRSRLLAARVILMADRCQNLEEISRVFQAQGLTRPIREGLSRPLVDSELVRRILGSWESTRGIGLSVSQRLRFAASGDVMPSPEDLQRQFAEQVDRWWNKPGRVDYVPPQKPAAEHQTTSGVVGRQPEGDRTPPPAESDATPRVNNQVTPVVSIEETPLERTLALLKGSSRAKSLVKFLHGQSDWKATLCEFTRRLYSKGREPTAALQDTAKQLIRRTATTLAGRKAPLRIEYDWDQGQISLADVAASPGTARPYGKDVADVVK